MTNLLADESKYETRGRQALKIINVYHGAIRLSDRNGYCRIRRLEYPKRQKSTPVEMFCFGARSRRVKMGLCDLPETFSVLCVGAVGRVRIQLGPVAAGDEVLLVGAVAVVVVVFDTDLYVLVVGVDFVHLEPRPLVRGRFHV